MYIISKERGEFPVNAIKLTAVKQINYTYRTSVSEHCQLLLYTGSGKTDNLSFRRRFSTLLFPGQTVTVFPEGSAGNVLLISFRPDVLPAFVTTTHMSAPVHLCDPPDAYTSFFSSGWLLLESGTDDNAAYHTVSALIHWLFQFVPLSRQNTAGSSPKLLVEQAQNIIHNEYASDLTLQAVAAQLFVNPCYLSTVFHQVSGITFRAYLKNVRLQHTCHLLTQTNHLITDIAMQTGFNSTAYLISSFRKEYGMTPNAYRAMHAER